MDEELLRNLLMLFDIESKKDLRKHAKDIIIHQDALVGVILASKSGLLPYSHRINYKDYVPKHLNPSDAEHSALSSNGIGKIKGDALKCMRKISQIFKDRRYLVGHLFQLSGNTKWHLFFFTQRDSVEKDNHWACGSHIHFINYLWGYDLNVIWKNFITNGETPKGALHIRYKEVKKGEKNGDN